MNTETNEVNPLSKIEYKPTCLGYHVIEQGKDKKQWECIRFDIKINGQSFQYHVGLSHVKTQRDFDYKPMWENTARSVGYTEITEVPNKGKFYNNSLSKMTRARVKQPKIEDVLHCLISDSDASEYCFEDWCDNFGYDSDSISARKIYDECLENYHKLKKALGRDYTTVKEYIQKLEL